LGTGYGLSEPGFKSRQGHAFISLPNAKTGPEVHPAIYTMGIGVLSREESGRNMNLPTYLHPVPRLRMCGSITLYPTLPFLHKNGASRSTYIMSSDGVISESAGRDGVGSGNVAFNVLSGNLPEGNDVNDERHQPRRFGLRTEIHSRDLPKNEVAVLPTQLQGSLHCASYVNVFFFRNHGSAA